MLTWIRQRIASRTANETTVLKNSAWLSVAEIGSRVARGGLAIVAARMLGASGLGTFTYALALGGFLMFFEEAGIGTYVTRAFSKDTTDRNSVLASAIVLKGILLGLAILIFLCVGPLISSIPDARVLIPIIAIVIASDSVREFLFSITRAQQQMRIESTVKLVSNALVVGCGILFMVLAPSPLSLALGYAAGSAIGLIVISVTIRSSIPPIQSSFEKSRIKEIFAAAWPFTLIAVSNVVMFNTDSLFLAHYADAAEVGLYGSAVRLVQLFYILPALFSIVTFPIIVRKLGTTEGMKYALRKSLTFMLSVATLLTVVMATFSSFLVTMLFGTEFAPAAPMLAILALSYVPVFTVTILNSAVFAMDKQKQFAASNVAGMILNALLNATLIPHLGGIGAAISTTVSLTLIATITVIKFRRIGTTDAS